VVASAAHLSVKPHTGAIKRHVDWRHAHHLRSPCAFPVRAGEMSGRRGGDIKPSDGSLPDAVAVEPATSGQRQHTPGRCQVRQRCRVCAGSRTAGGDTKPIFSRCGVVKAGAANICPAKASLLHRFRNVSAVGAAAILYSSRTLLVRRFNAAGPSGALPRASVIINQALREYRRRATSQRGQHDQFPPQRLAGGVSPGQRG
jgi:hypothetical protein